MANYLYSDARNEFYLGSGTQSEQGGSLEGQNATSASVNILLNAAEKKVAVLLFPFWKEGMVPFLNNLEVETSWLNPVLGGSSSFALPTNFYHPISGWLSATDIVLIAPKVFFIFVTADFNAQVPFNFYTQIGTGVNINDLVPVYFEAGYMKFFRVPRGTLDGSNNIFLKYFKLPKAVDDAVGSLSDLHSALMPLTVAFMLADFFAIDGASLDLAIGDIKQARASEYFQAAVGKLGFNPYRWSKDGQK